MNLSSFFAAEEMRGELFCLEPESILSIRQELDRFYSDLQNRKESIEEALDHVEEVDAEERADITNAVEFAFSTVDRSIFLENDRKAKLLSLIKTKYLKEADRVKYILLILKHLLEEKEPLEFHKAVLSRFGFCTEGIEVMTFVCRISNVELRECFEAWREHPSVLRFLGESKREELQSEIASYFIRFPEERLEEDIIRWFVQWIQTEAKKTKKFESLVEKVKKRVESIREKGMALYDVTMINYALGNVRGCF